MDGLLTLGIESSCDETSASVVLNGRKVLSNIISSQIDLHKEYGGVVPEIASRQHVELIIDVIDQALNKAGVQGKDLNCIGVTYGPGLVGALLVGLTAAKAYAYALNKPLVGVHHIEGHISANFLQYPELEPPFLCLVVSGGHSHIIECKDYSEFKVVAATRDDAAGEAFDKISRALGLGYPGGPVIDRIASTGNPDAIHFPQVHFGDSLDFSFSGVKTAVLNYVHNTKARGEEVNIPDVCASFQSALVNILTQNAIKAAKELGYDKIALAGGVAANSNLRITLEQECNKNAIGFYRPAPILCTDNGAMIACAAHYRAMKGKFSGLDLNAVPNLKFDHV